MRRSPYLYLPVDVPAGASRIDVRYSFSDPMPAPRTPGNVVDIGLFDSRGSEFLEATGFRGWSGSARPEFFITPQEATPGYVRGPLYPGRWQVILGVERLAAEGVRYEVEVDVTLDEDAPPPPAAGGAMPSPAPETALAPDDSAGRWLKGDLHCHTLHSDGSNTVEEIVRNAVERGLDFLAVTDHNTITHHEEMDALSHLPIILIPGEEITTYWGHANTWGLREWIDFRCADAESMAAVQRFVASKGALISINHPKSFGPPWLLEGWAGYPSMEVWQAPWRWHNWESMERWEARLVAGQRVVAVGGSDTHAIPPAAPRHPHGLGNPCTWVWVEGRPSAEAVLDAVRKGHAFINDDPRGAQLTLSADADGDGRFEVMMGDTLEAERRVAFRVWTNGGTDRRLFIVVDGRVADIVVLEQPECEVEFTLDASEARYVRAELRGFRGSEARGEVVWAMTNPIWLGHGAE